MAKTEFELFPKENVFSVSFCPSSNPLVRSVYTVVSVGAGRYIYYSLFSAGGASGVAGQCPVNLPYVLF